MASINAMAWAIRCMEGYNDMSGNQPPSPTPPKPSQKPKPVKM